MLSLPQLPRPVIRNLCPLCVACSTLFFTSTSHATQIWKGDFETGDTSQWSYLLNKSGISVVSDPVYEGASAALIEITNGDDHIWPNGLNRVEFQYAPGLEYTGEGTELFFTWSLYLPTPLTEDEHQIAYVESDQSYQQTMSFIARGTKLWFFTRKPMRSQWTLADALTPAVWHRIGLHVKWSKDSSLGFVNVWFDGEQVVQEASCSSLADDNQHFVQLGILRDTIDTPEKMVVDDAVHHSTWEEFVEAQLGDSSMQPMDTTDGTAADGTTTTGADGTATTGADDTTGMTTSDLPESTPSTPAQNSSNQGCSLAPSRGGSSGGRPLFYLLGGLLLVIQLRRHPRRNSAF